MRYSVLCLLGVACAAPSQLYLSTSSAAQATSLNAQQSSAVLASLLDVAHYEAMPLSTAKGDSAWRAALEGDWRGQGKKVVLLIESDQISQVLPNQLQSQKPYTLPSLPTHSWAALLTLQLHRLADQTGVPLEQAYGLQSFITGIKALEGWKNWVGEELGARIGWHNEEEKLRIAQIKERPSMAAVLTDINFLDHSADVLVQEVESMFALVDSHAAASYGNDDGPQGSLENQIVAIHIKGLKAIEALHGASSKQFKTAAALLQQTLTATLDSILKQSPESTVILLSLPTTYSPPVFRKRSSWLRPFYDAHHDLTRRTAAPAVLQKRSSANFDPVLESANRAAAPKRTAIPIVPSSFTCFESLDKLNNATNSCNDGNGVGVKGVSALMGKNREDCWVCNCGSTVTKGKKTNWKGQGCEKIDLSSDFTLIFFSSLILVVILYASVALLYGVGNVELPGTLASVNGTGFGGKRA